MSLLNSYETIGENKNIFFGNKSFSYAFETIFFATKFKLM